MNGANLRPDGRQRWTITGSLDFDSVPRLWQALAGQLGEGDQVLDLSGVTRANSAGLVLLLEAYHAAHRHGGRLRVEGLPDSLRELGAMSDLGVFLDELRS